MTVVHRVRSALRGRELDVALYAAALLILLPTFWYRYGLDQSLYHYVGVGWMHGRLPYRDAFDVKPPGIYFVYGVVGMLFGGAECAIHVVEACGILAAGWCAAVAVRAGDGEPAPGLAGALAVLLATWYATTFGFWDTGQVELWEAICVVAGFAFAVRSPRTSRSVALGGAFLGLAVLFKVTAAVPGCVVFAGTVLRARNGAPNAPRTALLVAFGALLPVAVTVAYFGVAGGLPALIEWSQYLPHYAAQPLDQAWVKSIGPEMLLAGSGIWIAVFAAPTVWGLRDADARNRARACWALGLTFAGALSIALQRRYFSYHPVVMGPLLVLGAGFGMKRWLRADTRGVVAGLALACFGAFYGSARWTGNDFMTYRAFVLHAFAPYVRGALHEDRFLASFSGPFEYTYVASKAAASLILQREPHPGDALHVRGYDTTLYTLTGLYSPSRFFMEAPVTTPYLLAYAPAWRDEHDQAVEGATAPRFFVTQTRDAGDIAALLERGYGLVGARDRYVVFDRELDSHAVSAQDAVASLVGRSVQGSVFGAVSITARFAQNGELTGDVGGGPFAGRWTTKGDQLCVLVDEHRWCGKAFRSKDEFLMVDEAWKELARVSLEGPTDGAMR